ncbi:RagB/SusD family nutrient uptake outer membrane protein [Chryseobacterium sp. KBW03]|uniref:RagB/SusD family nutrient uptake outer membrane protein n=1 Tax=Chryseobacterium sp. KBW03 TaxID=2153362 RepID=UPI000F5928D3|nr:RagB/SusD family nutrient uptake outer membrane protein [Chryseobacterium sp. KBW03]RQO35376.1 RagB/SusD family nutrient uptake outer membrane protein [Chryseobacterium sp. KBW03]
MKKIIKSLLPIAFLFLMPSCSKDWLEEKQDIKLVVPTTLNDLSLLMNSSQFLYDGRGAMEVSCDDLEVSLEQYNGLSTDFERKLLTWNVDIFPKLGNGITLEEWELPYAQIQVCNVALKALEKIIRTASNGELYDRIKGTALYHRSRAFLNLAMTFCKYYDASTADTDLGIPIKLDEDINEPIFRSTLKQTYQRITDDLSLAAMLLPQNAISVTHITNAGAYALLARTYLYMNDYGKAYDAAQNSLKFYSVLDDYNTFNAGDSRPFLSKSKEVHIMIEMATPYNTAVGLSSYIPDDLYSLYTNNDLRKILYFRIQDGKNVWRGSPIGNNLGGTATNEVILIGAECAARMGNKIKAVELLNILLIKRFKTGTFIPIAVTTDTEALDKILLERRKELLKRGLRFQDLKRLNKDPRYAKTLTRIVGDQTYTLLPNDKRYLLPIPQYIINYNGIEQN